MVSRRHDALLTLARPPSLWFKTREQTDSAVDR